MTTATISDDDLKNRRDIFDQMMAILRASSFEADAAFTADMEPLISGKMTPEEHRAYLINKYK